MSWVRYVEDLEKRVLILETQVGILIESIRTLQNRALDDIVAENEAEYAAETLRNQLLNT